ncbi:MAG: hypothetical protein A2270_10210 [Elusimicrobia bacterium RIFOXYA12_FULL_51_18]|nr:MAG: hypothetical protein A2270_10210 [Elusimicrobia bacterium RIFOXYA12_FULL_51_18]OGS29562.1 MAG: hypothetical protein A2218_00980 [Elusimicrobia bacterium RIFOXYA2_FULL_53_38]
MTDFKRQMVYAAALARILFVPAFPLQANAGLTFSEITVSSYTSDFKPLSPANLNTPGAFEGVIAPTGFKKYDRQAEMVFFSNTFSGLPALAFSGRRGKHGFLILGEYSKLPRIKDEGVFLRSAGVPVRSVTKETYISGPNGASTATYTSDSIDAFRNNTAMLDFFYYREAYKNEFARAGLLAGIPLAWHTYKVSVTLADGLPFDENRSAMGLGASVGVAATFGSNSVQHKGPVCSVFLIYNRIWFGGSGGELSRHLRARLNGFRFGFSAGWRFSSY